MFSSLENFENLFLFSFTLIFTMSSAGTAKSTVRQVLFFIDLLFVVIVLVVVEAEEVVHCSKESLRKYHFHICHNLSLLFSLFLSLSLYIYIYIYNQCERVYCVYVCVCLPGMLYSISPNSPQTHIQKIKCFFCCFPLMKVQRCT